MAGLLCLDSGADSAAAELAGANVSGKHSAAPSLVSAGCADGESTPCGCAVSAEDCGLAPFAAPSAAAASPAVLSAAALPACPPAACWSPSSDASGRLLGRPSPGREAPRRVDVVDRLPSPSLPVRDSCAHV